VLRWSIEERRPTDDDQRNTFLARGGCKDPPAPVGRRRGAVDDAVRPAGCRVHPRFLFSVGFSGVVVATGCYLVTEFALRPVAAQALEAGPPPRRLTAGIMGRTMIVWLLVRECP